MRFRSVLARPTRPAPLGSHLVWLVLVALLPVLALSAVVFFFLWQQQQQTVERGLVDTARAQAFVVERELESTILALGGLARSEHLAARKFSAFYDESVRVMRGHPTWSTVALVDLTGRQLLNLRRPFGEALPPFGDNPTFEEVVRTRQPAVSGLWRGTITGQWTMAVMVPVGRGRDVRAVLMVAIDQPTWAELLARWKVPEDWFGSLVDQHGVIIARTRAPERFVGSRVPAEYLARSRGAPEGVFKQSTLEGVAVYVAFAAVPTAGWSVMLAIPAALVERTPQRLVLTATLAVLAAVGVAVTLAVYLSRRITRPIAALSAAAEALGRGEALPGRAARTNIAEVEQLAETLERAAGLLRERSAERDRALEERAQLLAREQAARAEAEAANRGKDEFLAVLSHELRTPLNAMLGWVRMLRSGRLDAVQVEHGLEVIDRNTTLQARLINDLLDVSRIVAGKLQLELRPVNLGEIARHVVESFSRDAAGRGIELRASLDLGAGTVRGDAVRLQQILGNLLSNALKFTPPGGSVRVRLGQAGDRARLAVADSGEGIAPDVLPHIFDRFRQADSTSARRRGGLGLGLAIVRHLVELHGGSIRAESEGPGRGATFTVELPLLAQGPAAAGGEDAETGDGRAPRLEGVRVLVVEDEADFRELATRVLAEAGAEVSTAASAAEALALIEDGAPDVLVSDLGLPGSDGFALLESVRALRSPRGEPAAIALTAFADGETRARALAAGFRVYATKPISPRELVALVARAAGRRVEA